MQALVRAGLAAGDQLMPSHPSNPDGHFEDMEVVALHQAALEASQRDWFSLGQAVQPSPATYKRSAQKIIQRLQSCGSDWGFKDPRACLFLDWWFEQLERPAGVFIYRHYRACNRSLRMREAQELACSAEPDTVDLRFWKDPHHGLRLWADYNRCLLTFAREQSQRVLVVPYDAMISGFNIAKAVNKRFGLSLNASAESGIRTGPVGLTDADRELPDIPAQLHDELESILAGLNALSVNGAVSVGALDSRVRSAGKDRPASSNTLSQIDTTLHAAGFSGVDSRVEYTASVSTRFAVAGDDAERLEDDEDFSDWDAKKIGEELEAAIVSSQNERAMRIASLCEQAHFDQVKLQLFSGQIWLRQGDLERANRHLQRAYAIDPDNKNGLVLLGLLAERQQRYDEGVDFFDAVLSQAPNNMGAYLHSARCFIALNKTEQALQRCELGLRRNAHFLPLQQCKLDVLKATASADVVADYFETLLAEYPNNAVLLMRYSHFLAELGDTHASGNFYYQSVQKKIASNSAYTSLLREAVGAIEPAAESQRLERCVCKELAKVFNVS